MPPQLTRYLYFLDECLYSLMFSLIRAQKSSLEEVVFWAGEIYYSGFKDLLWKHIWKIYYDFYYVYNPGLESLIREKEKSIKDYKINFNNLNSIIDLIYNHKEWLQRPIVFYNKKYIIKFYCGT